MEEECIVVPLMRDKGKGTAHVQEDLMSAAEAVVDAALWCHSLRGSGLVPAEIRQALIEAVFRDPTLTPHLFGKPLSSSVGRLRHVGKMLKK